MVTYYGRHSCKQFIRAKPIRFGYMLWVSDSATGLPQQVEIYEGSPKNQSNNTLGAYVVKMH